MAQDTQKIIGNPAWDGGKRHRAELIANTRDDVVAIALSSMAAGVFLTLMVLAALSGGHVCSL